MFVISSVVVLSDRVVLCDRCDSFVFMDFLPSSLSLPFTGARLLQVALDVLRPGDEV